MPPEENSRDETVQRAAGQWVKTLRDMSGRNRLLAYRDLKAGTLDLVPAHTSELDRLLEGRTTRMRKLFPASGSDDGTDNELQNDALRRARAIHKRTQEHFEELGIKTLFAAWGMATWRPEQGSSFTPMAPVLLHPAEIKRENSSGSDFNLSLVSADEWILNEALLQYLSSEFKAEVPSELLDIYKEDAILERWEAEEIFKEFSNTVEQTVPGFSIEYRLVLGNFMYKKLPMVKDLEDNLDLLIGHDLIAAIAGSGEARKTISSSHSHDVDSSQPDKTPPESEFLVLDTDSSQNAVINAALADQSCVVQGPPGTGKSQTIANLIAAMMAQGKSVLFVAEKRAAIDAVVKRLTSAGLDQHVMDLHGGTGSRREMAKRLERSLTAIKETPPVDQSELHKQLVAARSVLIEHHQATHGLRDPWQLSFFEIQCQLLKLSVSLGMQFPGTPVLTFNSETLYAFDKDKKNDVGSKLREWADLSEPFRSGESIWASAWQDCTITSTQDRDQVESLLGELSDSGEILRQVEAQRRTLLMDLGTDDPGSFSAWDALLELLQSVKETLDLFTPEIFACDLEQLAAELTPLQRGAAGRVVARLFKSKYRASLAEIKSLRQPGAKVSAKDLLTRIQIIAEQQQTWKTQVSEESPWLPENFENIRESHLALKELLYDLKSLLNNLDPDSWNLSALRTQVRQLNDDRRLMSLPRLAELEEEFDSAGIDTMTTRARDGELSFQLLHLVFEHAWLYAVHRELLREDPRLGTFDGTRHHGLADQFREYDTKHLKYSNRRIRRRIAEQAINVCNALPEQDSLIRREANKKSRHLPLRKLFHEAPDLLTTLCPCWAMSPLDVAQTLPPQKLFDLVIFDEASQVRPSDAISSLLRGDKALVAGDTRQLPPTSFFDTAETVEEDDEEAAEEDLRDYESILDVMETMLRRRPLTWHYRSQDERLIAFSNLHIYDSFLTTFPGAVTGDCLHHELIPHRPEACLDTRSNSDEVQRVVELMIEHARERPDESLGVIAMGMHHAGRIEAALSRQLSELQDPKLEEYFAESQEERAFVKNLERVQGDERDAIILSVGYSKNPDGRLLYRFGPLNMQGGERRLNVAVTRARRRLTLVSSFSHRDMDPNRASARGVELLRAYIEYMDSGGTKLGKEGPPEPLNPFEVDVKDKLEQAGLRVVPQYGCSGYRIDFAVCHPDRPGEFVLAVEADGASYHSSPTARDRDRLRQEHLERLGWRFCRIWSTDWFMDHTREVQRVLDAYEQALNTTPPIEEEEAPRGEEPPEDSPQREGVPFVIHDDEGKCAPIGAYSQEHLIYNVEWIQSDGLLRTNEQIRNELKELLGFSRMGSRIREALQQAVETYRGRRQSL